MNFRIKKYYYRFFSILLSIVMVVLSVPMLSINANASNEDFPGIWLFNNVKYDTKHIHINNNGTMSNEGEFIELHPYNKYWAIRWYIKSVGNGYYKIESVFSDLVLTAPTGPNNDIVTQTTYTGANTQQWDFIRQSDGTYKISPKSNPYCYLLAGAESTTSDQDLEIRSSPNDYSDNWNLININHQYYSSIQHYYDFAYSQRFYSVSSTIYDYQDICSDILSELFNVKVNYSVKLFESSADLCTDGNSTTNICATHKTRTALRNNIISKYGTGNTTTARVIWTGHALTSWQSNFNTGSQTIVITIDMATSGSPNYTNKSNSDILNQRVYTLLHETSHHLGAVDHYCYMDPQEECSNPGCFDCYLDIDEQVNCVMQTGILTLKAKLDSGNLEGIYCSYCTSNTYEHSIVKHLNDHH